MRPRTAVDNTRSYHRIHLEVTSPQSPATATTFLTEEGRAGRERGGTGGRFYGVDAQDTVVQWKECRYMQMHSVCFLQALL